MSANQPVIIRRRVRRDFTTLPNDLIRDRRLSWKALGLVVYILSLPDDFRLRLSYLTKQKKDGRDGTRAGLKELEHAGYLTIRQERGERGKFAQVIWEVTDEPCGACTDKNPPCSENPNTVNPNTVNPNTDKPDSENPTLINTNNKQELKTKRTTTTNPAEDERVVVDLDDLIWPRFLLYESSVHASALKILRECPEAERQNVLHEIGGLADKGAVRSPIGLLHKLVDLAKQSRFVPAAALVYQRKLENESKITQSRIEQKRQLQESRSPQAKETAMGHLSELLRRTNV